MSENTQPETPTFMKRLARLFSGQAVVRKTRDNKLRVVDPSMLQSLGKPVQPAFQQGYYSGLHTYKPTGYYTPTTAFNFNTARIELYRDYEAMDEDPILSSALDIYADECTVRGPEGTLVSISTNNSEIKEILHNLFYDILNVDFNLWPWIRNACKYGDFYLKLDIQDEVGIVSVTPMSPYDVSRSEGFDEKSLKQVKFNYSPSDTVGVRENFSELQYFEVAHFRLLSDTNFLPYGRSMLEAARKEFKRLALMEDAMMIHRIMRAPQRRVYKINVGNLNPTEIDDYMRTIMDKNKKTPYIDEETGQYNLKFNLQNMIEDIYIPVRGGDSQTEIDTLDGLSNEGMIDDVEYIRNKMMAALKIPKAFLGYDENLEGKAVLAAEDVRFARTIERIQKIFESELTKLAIIHLYLQGYTDYSLVDFELKLNNPSIVYERQKMEIMNEKMQLINAIRDTGMFTRKYIYENIVGLSLEEWLYEEDNLINDKIKEWSLNEASNNGRDPFSENPEEEQGGEEGGSSASAFGGGGFEDEPTGYPEPSFGSEGEEEIERGSPFEPPRETSPETEEQTTSAENTPAPKKSTAETKPAKEAEKEKASPVKKENVNPKYKYKSKKNSKPRYDNNKTDILGDRDITRAFKSTDTFPFENITNRKLIDQLTQTYNSAGKRQRLTELLNPDLD